MSLFKEFRSHYTEDRHDVTESDATLPADIESHAAGITELLESSGGSSFDDGLYRLHSLADLGKWTTIVEQAFPQYKGHIVCFAYDWLGRQFALDQRKGKQWHVLMIEPGTGDGIVIPASFADFHNVELVEYAEEALAEPFFDDWLESGGDPLEPSQCVGYIKPLFQGGSDDLENLELTDMEAYWQRCADLLQSGGDDE